MTDQEFSDYCREVSAAYWAEEAEFKAGIHPSQVRERIEKWLNDHNEKGKITFLAWDNLPLDHVKVSVDNKFYGLFDYKLNKFTILENKGWCIIYVPWEDLEGKPRVIGRFKTTEEKNKKLEEIYEPGNGWLEEELQTVSVINDYNYTLER